ncbi:hypothetical protein BC829DRAFT_15692 [Chytridium lagenaria]|nr:hypothetical protein BC829DRAFT_15692 [Chytridium lagenaria]
MQQQPRPPVRPGAPGPPRVRRYCRSIRAACCPQRPNTRPLQPQPQPAPSIPEEYTEFSLYSSGPGMPAHIMRINAPRFSFSNLVPPLKMVRKIPEAPPPAVVDDDPVAAAAAKKKANLFKKKLKPMFFGVGEDGEASLHVIRKKDPDRFPWALTDFKEEELEGNLEGSQRANYVLFIVRAEEDALSDKEVKPRDGFRVKPVSKWYKFNSRPKYATLTAEEAEARMTSRKKSNEQRWFMRNMKEKEEDTGGMVVEGEVLKKEEEEELKRIMKRNSFKVTSDAKSIKKKGDRDGIEEELDFDEVMSDDENPDFGIENEEEAKEAKKREFGDMARKAKFEEDEVFDDEDAKKKAKAAGSKSLTRVLKKNERESVYISDDEDKNPYDSEADDSDEEEQPNEIVEVIGKEDIAGAAATAAVSSISTGVVNSGAPGSSKAGSPTLQKGKKREVDTKGDAVDRNAKKLRKEGATSGSGSPALGKKQKPSTSQSSPGLSSSSTSPKLGNGKSAGSSASPSPSVGGGSSPPIGGGMKIKLKMGSSSTPDVGGSSKSPASSPHLKADEKKRKSTDAPAPEPKRFKIKMGNSPEIAPPPPSAADIIADDRNRRIAVRKSGWHTIDSIVLTCESSSCVFYSWS